MKIHKGYFALGVVIILIAALILVGVASDVIKHNTWEASCEEGNGEVVAVSPHVDICIDAQTPIRSIYR